MIKCFLLWIQKLEDGTTLFLVACVRGSSILRYEETTFFVDELPSPSKQTTKIVSMSACGLLPEGFPPGPLAKEEAARCPYASTMGQ